MRQSSTSIQSLVSLTDNSLRVAIKARREALFFVLLMFCVVDCIFVGMSPAADAHPATSPKHGHSGVINEKSGENISTLSLFRGSSGGTVEQLFSGYSAGALFGPNGGRSISQFFEHLTEEQQKAIIDRAFPLMSSKWDGPSIFVCWEEVDAELAEGRALVEKSIGDTWAMASALKFIAWNHCSSQQSGIHISVRDDVPETKTLGKYNDKIKDGMILNLVFKVHDPECSRDKKTLEMCIKMTAVHEFGHAIGFSHEQNRSDTPEGCLANSQRTGHSGDDEQLTVWDEMSVMNYCNPSKQFGVLSKLDKLAVQKIYGKP